MKQSFCSGKGFPLKVGLAVAAGAVVLSLLFVTAVQWCRRARAPQSLFSAAAEGGGATGRVILLLADRLTYTDLLHGAGPNLSSVLEEGAVALMNVRSGRAGSESGYLSIGTAARAAAGAEGRSAFGEGEFIDGENAAVVFKRCTGNEPSGTLFHLQAAALQEKNSTLPYPVKVGLLGEALRERGLTAAVWGNADGAVPNRCAVLVAMNAAGEVRRGLVGAELLQEAPLFPYGVCTDVNKLAGTVAANMMEADLHLVEFGDSSRLDEYWPQLNPVRGAALLGETLRNLDRLLGELRSALGENDVLLLAVPSLPQNRSDSGAHLAPALLVTGGNAAGGLLGSTSTRRPGLIQNTDLAPLILDLLGGEKSDPGRSAAYFSIIPEEEPRMFLEGFNRRAGLVFEQRALLLKPYIALLMLVLLAALAGICLHIRPVLKPARYLIGMLLLVPPVLLLLPALFTFPLAAAPLSGLLLCGTALAAALLFQPLAERGQLLYWTMLGWGIVLLLLLDTLAGAPLQQLSLFSYDPVGGARYYGVGNEYMGVLIGAALLGTVSLAAGLAPPAGEKATPAKSRIFSLASPSILLLYGLIIFVLAAPNFGANLGGCLTAAVAFGVSWAGLSQAAAEQKGRFRRRVVLSVLFFLLVAAGLLWLLNIPRSGPAPSHVGLFGEMLRLRGPAVLQETALRKLAMNLRLMRYSIWSRAFLTLAGLCIILSLYPGGFLKRLHREQPYLVVGVGAALAGAAAALLTNDSGVVAAATLLLYAVPPALLAVMQKNLHRGCAQAGERQD